MSKIRKASTVLGVLFEFYCEKNKILQRELADSLQISPSELSSIKSGSMTPSNSLLADFSHDLGVSKEWLVDLLARVESGETELEKHKVLAHKEQVIADLKAGFTRERLASKYRVSYQQIALCLREWGFNNTHRDSQTSRLEKLKKEILPRLERGEIKRELAEEYGISYQLFVKITRDWGVVRYRQDFESIKQDIIQGRERGLTLESLGIRHNCSATTIKYHLKKWKIED